MRTAMWWLLMASLVGTVQAQTGSKGLIERFRAERFRAKAEALQAQHGPRVAPLPLYRFASRFDTLLAPPEPVGSAPEPPSPPFVIERWELVPKLASDWFTERFRSTRWSFLGSNRPVPLDTTMTRDLRARLEAAFGAPTRTLAELDAARNLKRADYVQFEYWFVLNDSIPFKVVDVNGPRERGLVVITDSRYRESLPALRKAFLDERLLELPRASYIDYYYDFDARSWYLTGYVGGRFFLDRISAPDLRRGRPAFADRPMR